MTQGNAEGITGQEGDWRDWRSLARTVLSLGPHCAFSSLLLEHIYSFKESE